MKNFLFVFFSLLFPFSVHAQSVSVIPHLSSIALNKDETVTVTPYHYGMACGGKNCGNKIVLRKGEKYSFGEHHAYGSVTYKGIKDNQLVFEIISGFNANSFGGTVSENKREKIVFPYTKEQFAQGREQEILEHTEFNEENKEEIIRLVKKLGIATELLWKKYHDLKYVKLLIENGADINYTNKDGETILFSVLSSKGWDDFGEQPCVNKASVIQTFIDLGIDVHHKDNKNKEALDYVKEKIRMYKNDNDNYGNRNYSCLLFYEEILKGNNPLKADKETCNNLQNFEFIKNAFGKEYCSPNCPEGQFRDHTGQCFSCNHKHERLTTDKACSKCPNRISKKSYEPGYVECERKYVFCPEGTIKEAEEAMAWAEKYCVSCTSTREIWTTPSECEKCPERTYKKGKCSLK